MRECVMAERAGDDVCTNLGEGTVVPDVSVVGEAVAHVAQTTLLDVLLDGVERLLLGDFHLGIGPAGNLDDHVEYAIVPIRKERDVVERRDNLAILLDVDAMFCHIDRCVEILAAMCLEADIPRVLGAPMSRGV
jgi:hypothetical protein